MSSKSSPATFSGMKREVPFVAFMVALCVVSAALGAVFAAYQEDGHFIGLQMMANRNLNAARRSLAAIPNAGLFKTDDDVVNVDDFDWEGEDEPDADDKSAEEDEADRRLLSSTDNSERRELAERRQLSKAYCRVAKLKSACIQRARDAQIPCSWRNGACKFRPGSPIPQQTPPPGSSATLAPTPSPLRIQSCINDISNCPVYPAGQLAKDWKVRFTPQATCAPEKGFYNIRCLDVCDTLFNQYVETVPWGLLLVRACSVGCAYAKNMFDKQLMPSTCHADCKNTVWHYQADGTKCRYQYGMELAVITELHPDSMGAGKACEIGCLAANDRPCPALNKHVGWLP